MTNFTICLAGIPIAVSAMYPYAESFCREYIIEDQPECALSITQEDIEFERECAVRLAEAEGRKADTFSDPNLEILAIYRKIAELLIPYHILLFHGSAVAVEGEVYLFTAKSGTGKTTHTQYWLEKFGSRAIVVNGDKPLIKVCGDKVLVCGTPWCGKEHLGKNVMLPLKALCILTRDDTNHIERISLQDALSVLLVQTYKSADAFRYLDTLSDLDRFLNQIPVYRLGCTMDPAAADVAYEGMQSQ